MDCSVFLKVEDKEVTFEDIKTVYYKNQELFDTNAYKVTSNSENIKHVQDLFQNNFSTSDKDLHVEWFVFITDVIYR